MTEYKKIKKVNQSSLKKILDSPRAYLSALKKQESTEESTEEHFVFGSLLDTMLTGHIDELDKYYKITSKDYPSDTIREIIDRIFTLSQELGIGEDLRHFEMTSTILHVCKEVDYGQSWKPETRCDKVIHQGEKYFNVLFKTKDLIKIDENLYNKAVNCKATLHSDEFTSYYVRKTKGVEFLNKFIVEFEYLNLKMKGEIDRIVVDHNKKEIIPIDFKQTGSSIDRFNNDFWKFRYDFQAAAYTIGVLSDPRISKLREEGYKLKNFKYIVVEKELINRPRIFNVTNDVLKIGVEGGSLSRGMKLEGLAKAVARLNWHTLNEKWDHPMEYYNNKELDIII